MFFVIYSTHSNPKDPNFRTKPANLNTVEWIKNWKGEEDFDDLESRREANFRGKEKEKAW